MSKVKFDDAELRERLTPMQYYVTQEAGTERAFTGEYDKFYEDGRYRCVVCGAELFTSQEKYNSGCGWPAFYATAEDAPVAERVDTAYGMVRTEVVCDNCGAHLGHVFPDGPPDKTGMRYCINSASLSFVPVDAEEDGTP